MFKYYLLLLASITLYMSQWKNISRMLCGRSSFDFSLKTIYLNIKAFLTLISAPIGIAVSVVSIMSMK